MAISKLNAEQFANMAVNAAGVIFEYAGKDGKNTAMHFFGADYEATVKTQDEMFRVLRNVVTTFWDQRIAAPRIERRYPLETPCRNSAPAHHPHLRRRYGQSFRPRRKRMGTNRVNADQKGLGTLGT